MSQDTHEPRPGLDDEGGPLPSRRPRPSVTADEVLAIAGHSPGDAGPETGASHPVRRFLSMPDPESGSRLDWIRYKLGTGPEPEPHDPQGDLMAALGLAWRPACTT
jgi:hypothetical protein